MSRMRAIATLAVRAGGSALFLAYFAARLDVASVQSAAERVSWRAFAIAFAALLALVPLAAVRFRLVLRALAPNALPTVRALVPLVLAGNFLNTFLPGAVAGDVLRGVVVRDAFAGARVSPLAAAFSAVFIDRSLGLLSMGVVGAALMAPSAALVPRALALVAGGTVALALCALFAVRLLARAASSARVSERWRTRAALFVTPADWRTLFAPMALAVGAQALTALALAVLVADVVTSPALLATGLATGLAIVALIAAMFPLSYGGLGPREAAFAVCLAPVGVSAEDAIALSLSYFAVSVAAAALGLPSALTLRSSGPGQR